MSSSEPTLLYDPDEHHAAPIGISWITRSGFTSDPRWLFIRCCGQVGRVCSLKKDGVLHTRKPCVHRAPETMHIGQMVLCRTNSSQVNKHGSTLPIAKWQCCGDAVLSTWEAAWDADYPIPPATFGSGCGQWDASIATHGISVAPGRASVACQARPLSSHRCSSARSVATTSGGTSSGLEQITLGPITVSVEDVLPTQRFVNLMTFTTPNGHENVFDVMVNLIDLANSSVFPYALKSSPPWPPIRVARQMRSHDHGASSADAGSSSSGGDGDSGSGSGGGSIFSIDNRRLFMLKVLGVATIEAEEIGWMHEFDSKLKQGDPPAAADTHAHCRTNDGGVLQGRQRLDAMVKSRILDAKLGADEAALLQDIKELKRRYTTLAGQLKQVRAERAAAAAVAAVGPLPCGSLAPPANTQPKPNAATTPKPFLFRNRPSLVESDESDELDG